MADDDINGPTNVVIACLVDDENCDNYRRWFVEQIIGQGARDRLLSIVLFTLTSFNRQQKEKDGVWELG